jgi:hypothetical protein
LLITVNGARLQTLHQGSADKEEGEEGRHSGIIMITITLMMIILIVIVVAPLVKDKSTHVRVAMPK